MDSTSCNACSSGPVGVAGHPHLRAQSIGHLGSAYRCDDCHVFWSRSTGRDGGTEWAPISEQLAFDPTRGTPLPQLAGSDDFRPLPYRGPPRAPTRLPLIKRSR